MHDNLCYLTINCDTGQHSQFLRCFLFLLTSEHPCFPRYACWLIDEKHLIKGKVTHLRQANIYNKNTCSFFYHSGAADSRLQKQSSSISFPKHKLGTGSLSLNDRVVLKFLPKYAMVLIPTAQKRPVSQPDGPIKSNRHY